jgi:hypothetical protein
VACSTARWAECSLLVGGITAERPYVNNIQTLIENPYREFDLSRSANLLKAAYSPGEFAGK